MCCRPLVIKEQLGILRIKVVGHRLIGSIYSLLFQQSGNIEGAITEARCCSSDIPQGGLEVPCTVRFSGDAKLGRYYKLGASKNINIDRIYFDASTFNYQFIKFNPPSNFLAIWYQFSTTSTVVIML